MSSSIRQDHSRFRNIVKGMIKKDLKKYITHGEMIGRKGKELVSIPVPQIEIPRFRFGDKEQGGVGQGDGEPGDAVGQGDPQDGDEPGQGEAGEGEPRDRVPPRDQALSSPSAVKPDRVSSRSR